MLRLVEHGTLDLDTDVNRYLTSWQVQDNELTTVEKVTLRRIASHTAGLTVHGFPGYATTEPLPTVNKILDGVSPANTDPVRVDTTPGTIECYSGGGTTVMQQLLVAVTGKPFPELMAELVLDPAGMTQSTFDQPLPATRATEAACAQFGLGPLIYGTGRNLRFGHGGTNEGFHCELVMYPELGVGAAIMTNGAGGPLLIREVRRALAAEYAWPDYGAELVPAVALDARTVEGLTGTYQLGPDPQFRAFLQQDGDRLVLSLPELPEQELVPKSRTSFVMSPLGWQVTVTFDSLSRATAITMNRGRGEPIEAKRTN